MKNSLKFVVFAVLVFLSVGITSKAYVNNFSGTVNYQWGYVTGTNAPNTKDAATYSVVNWSSSSQSGSHNMWFRIVNSNGENRGTIMIGYLTRVEFESTASVGYNYWLQARRENSVDPYTTVSGSWRP